MTQPTTTTTTTATPARRYAADPWDAPYFGGRVYLSYQPDIADTQPAAARVDAAARAAEVAALPRVAPGADAARSPNGKPAASGALARFDPWDAPYFGAPVYFGYAASPTRPILAVTASPATGTPATGTPAPAATSGAAASSVAVSRPSRMSRFLKWLRS